MNTVPLSHLQSFCIFPCLTRLFFCRKHAYDIKSCKISAMVLIKLRDISFNLKKINFQTMKDNLAFKFKKIVFETVLLLNVYPLF